MKKILAVLSAFLLMLSFFGCEAEPKPTVVLPSDGDSQNSDDITEDLASDETLTPAYSVTVATAYGDLYYQDQWLELMHIEQTMEEDVLTISFYGTVESRHYHLFSFVIGGQSGESVGLLTDASGTQRKVYAQMMDLGDISDLAENHQDRLFAMQEEINFIIENLK